MPFISKNYWGLRNVVVDFIPFVAPETWVLPNQYATYGCNVDLYSKFKAAKALDDTVDLAVEISEGVDSMFFGSHQVGQYQTLTIYETINGTPTSFTYTNGGGTYNFTSGSTQRYMIRTSPFAGTFIFPIGCVWGFMCCVTTISSIYTTPNTTLKYVFFTENSLTEINRFSNSGLLGKVTIPSLVTSLTILAFSNTAITKVVTSDNLSVIAGTNVSGAFYNCTSLTEADLGSGITSIGIDTFRSCTAMATLIVRATTPPTLEINSLRGLPTSCVIKVPSGSVAAYKAATYWSVRASQIIAI